MPYAGVSVQALIVDNNSADHAPLLEQLHRAGYTSVAVALLKQAWQAILSQSFDLFLLELELPDGNGLSLCHDIRERLGNGVVIIFVSAQATPAQRAVGIQLGADDFLSKPCHAEELLARIDAHRRRRGATAD